MEKKIIKSPKGMDLMNVTGTGMKGVATKLIYRKRSRLGKFLKVKKIITVKTPKDSRVAGVHNHTPKVGSVTLTFRKTR